MSTPSLLRRILVRFFTAVLLGAVTAITTYALLRPVELEYELEELAQEFERRLRSAGTDNGRPVIELEIDRDLVARLNAINRLHLRLIDPSSGHVLFSYDHDAASADVMTPLLGWPPGFFELGELDEDRVFEYGFIDLIRDERGLAVKFVARRGPPTTRDYVYWLGAEFGYELLPMFTSIVVVGSVFAAFALRRALVPLTRISELATTIRPGSRTRLPSEDVPREILPLVEAVNRALDRLQLALERQRQFTAFAAHELRTPLAALRARIDGLSVDLPERQALLRGVERMSHLVDQLLAVARLENGLVVPDEEVDLRVLVREVVADYAPIAAERDRDLALELPDRPVIARVHRDSLARALINLLDNAVKFSPAKSEVTVRLEPDGTLAVLDRGPGLDGVDAESLFRPFVRRRPREGDPGGSGLGLAIVREVADLHGGSVEARPREGGGTVFALRIPAHEETDA